MALTKICVNCGESFVKTKHVSLPRWERRLCCSVRCSNEHRRGTAGGELSHMWKGDEASYRSVHEWVRKRFPRTACEHCGETKPRMEWAVKHGHAMSRDRGCWLCLCVRCHRVYDGNLRNLGDLAHNGAKTHCPRGHVYDEANTYRNRGRRYCRTCGRERPPRRAARAAT